MNRDLIARLKMRAQDPKLRTDMCRNNSASRPVFLAEPCSTALIARAEDKLGFKLPPFLRTLYKEVANGSFGPVYGIIGLDEKGWLDVDLDLPLPELYATFRSGVEFGGPEWPDRLLPICNQGCGGYACVDATSPNAEMVFAEGVVFDREGLGFEQWMEKWVNGTLE